jgi:CDP-diacylglycerol---serine O-phosphatidyltransferase
MRRQSAELREQEQAAKRERQAQRIAAKRARRAARREFLASRMRLPRKLAREKVRRGAFLLPSMLTVGSVFLTYWAIVSIYNTGGGLPAADPVQRGQVYSFAAWLIFAAFLLDGLDGKVARLTGTSSEFGIQLDSLADVLSFGLAPSLLTFSWALQPLGRAGWLVAFLFVICGACRLARFNVQTVAAPDKRYFTGLPIPVAALTMAAIVLNFPVVAPRSIMAYAMLALVAVLSFLMVSRIKYRSFKDIDLHRARSPRTVVLFAVFLSVLFMDPQLLILLIMGGLVLSGPVGRVLPERWRSFGRRAGQRLEEIVEPAGDDSQPLSAEAVSGALARTETQADRVPPPSGPAIA